MAQDNLKKLSKDLAFKIFDPVNSGEDDGKIFFREHRLGYLTRAYGQLVRTLEIIHSNITKVFKDYHKILTVGDLVRDEYGQTAAPGKGTTYELDKPWHVFDVYYAETKGGQTKRADYIEPENYMPAKIGVNKHYIPDNDNRFWTITNNAVMFLPVDVEYYDIILFVRNYFPEFSFGLGGDLNIPQDYMDILITMAAMEAMSDKGDQTKYALYDKTLEKQLALINLGKQTENLREESKK